MKKILVFLLLIVFCFTMSGCGDGVSKTKNVNIIYVSDAYVDYNPKCPKCGHLNSACMTEISKGEFQSGYAQCNSCGEIFEMQIKR